MTVFRTSRIFFYVFDRYFFVIEEICFFECVKHAPFVSEQGRAHDYRGAGA